jgi:membrane protein
VSDTDNAAIPDSRSDGSVDGTPEEGDRGRQAENPAQVPAKGWKDVAARVKAEVKEDRVSLLSAGVAFYSLLALVPALAALISLYGLVGDPAQVQKRVTDLMGAAPKEARQLVTSQAKSIIEGSGGKVGLGLAVSILLALWSASSGMSHLVEAINLAYDEGEGRGFVKRRALALGLTIGGVVFVLLAIVVIAVLPAALAQSSVPSVVRVAVSVLRWPVLGVLLLTALGVLYRVAPDRDDPRWAWVSPGAIVATVLWLVGSILFSIYTANFGKYNETYGSLGAVVIVMLWLLLTAFAVIVGAELNSEVERQTRRDSTEGHPERMGGRGAFAADTVGPTAEQV